MIDDDFKFQVAEERKRWLAQNWPRPDLAGLKSVYPDLEWHRQRATGDDDIIECYREVNGQKFWGRITISGHMRDAVRLSSRGDELSRVAAVFDALVETVRKEITAKVKKANA